MTQAGAKSPVYKIVVQVDARPDGGVRVWSDDLPELVLSHADAEAVASDLPLALAAILAERLGYRVVVDELTALGPDPIGRPVPSSREFAARLAA